MTTSDDRDRRIPCEIEPGVWRMLAGDLYKDRRAVIREGISNGADAIHERLQTEPCDKLIKLYMDGNDQIIEDWGTGIVDLGRFTRISVPSYKKMQRQPGRIGYFGVGKTSYLVHSAIESVDFESVNNMVGMTLNLGPDNEDRLTYSNPVHCDRGLLMNHKGLKVRIKEVPKEKRMPTAKLIEYIGLTFAPKIALDGYRIIIDTNGKEFEVRPPSDFNPEYKEIFKLSDGSSVIGNIRKGQNLGRVEVYKKGVRIEALEFGYKIKPISWILLQTDEIQQTASRDSLQIDGQMYAEFEDKMLKYFLKNRFELADKPEQPKKKNDKQLESVTLNHISNYFRNHPTETPPDFFKDVKNRLQITSDDNKGQKKITKYVLSYLRKSGSDESSGGTTTNDPKRKYKKHKHKQEIEKGVGSQEGEGTPRIKYRYLGKGMDPLVRFDQLERVFVINTTRPSWTLFNKVVLSKAAQNEIARAVIRCMPDNQSLTIHEFDRKYYDLIDMGERGSN